jgi:nitrogen fixation NifU-like protein
MNAATDDVQAFYRDRVLVHSREPHHFGTLENPDRVAEGFNPLCGDKVTVQLSVADDCVADVAFSGVGCAISLASASMMTDALMGCTLEEAEELLLQAQLMFADGSEPTHKKLAELQALEGVRKYPSRIKCATLAWSTLDAALHEQSQQISTE